MTKRLYGPPRKKGRLLLKGGVVVTPSLELRGGGHDFMDATAEAIVGAARTHLAHGMTALMPTTLASSRGALGAGIAAFANAKDSPGCPERSRWRLN